MTGCVSETMENIVGKVENADYQHFLPFPQCFEESYSSPLSEIMIVWSNPGFYVSTIQAF